MLNRSHSLLGQLLLSDTIDFVSSPALEDEIFDVLSRPKFIRRFEEDLEPTLRRDTDKQRSAAQAMLEDLVL